MKEKIKCVAIVFLLIITLFVITGCGNNNDETTVVETKEELTSVSLNPELEGVYAFANKVESGKTTTVALKQDGSEVPIIEHVLEDGEDVEYERLDYCYGKLYLQKEKEFFAIDLNKGNGNYEIESVYKVSSEEEWNTKIMYVYNDIIYYNRIEKYLASYDLITGEQKEIDYLGDTDSRFVVDKKSGNIYYNTSPIMRFRGTWGGEFGIYNIETGEQTVIEKLDLKKADETNGDGKRFYMGPVTDKGFIYYEKTEGNYGKDELSGYEITTKITGYEYNVSTREKTKIDEYMDNEGLGNVSVYKDGKIYYVVNKLLGPSKTSSSLKVYENGEIKEIIEEQENANFDELVVFANGDIQVKIDGDNYSSYEAHENTYIINKDTLERTKTEVTYEDVAYITEGSDTHTERETTTKENEITKDDLVGNWKATTTDSYDFPITLIFGSMLNQNNKVTFNEDGSYTLGLGFGYNQTGNYEIQGNKVKLLNNTRTDDNPIDTILEELVITKEEEKVVLLIPTTQESMNTGEELLVNIRIEKE